MFCTSCGDSIPAGSLFCVNCGTSAPKPDEFETPSGISKRRLGMGVLVVIAALSLIVAAVALLGRGGGTSEVEKSSPVPSSTASTVTTIETTTTTLDPISLAKKSNPGLFSLATQFEGILTLSSQGRGSVGTVVGNVRSCAVTPDVAAREIDQVVDNRQAVSQQLSMLSNTGGPEGAAIIDSLRRAIRESVLADQYFSSWMKYLYATYYYARPIGCPNGSAPLNASYESAREASDRASAAKQQFVEQFNPIAERFGLATWSPGDI